MEMQTTKICSAESTSLEVSQLLWSIRSHPDSKTTQIHKQDATSYKKAIYPCRTDVHQLPLFCGAPLMQTSYWKPVWTHRTYQKNSSMSVSFPDGARLYLRALGSAFVAALTCLSLCWHAGRHLRTCHVELACSDIHTRARTIGDLLAAHEHVWIMLVFSSAVKPAFPLWGVCVWSWCTAPMWLRVFTSSSGREGKWVMTHAHRGSGCRHYPQQRDREGNGQIKKRIKGLRDSREKIGHRTYWGHIRCEKMRQKVENKSPCLLS